MIRKSPVPEGRPVSGALRRIGAIPAVRALLIQCASLAPTLAIIYLAARFGAAPGYLHVALAQGAVAALLSARLGLARWWCAIQFAFPLAVLGAQQAALPPSAFLGAFLVFLVLFWSTFRTQVPYYPSGRAVRAEVAALLPPAGAPRAIDIGSGFGGLALDLARRRPGAHIEGIELAPLPWLASRLRAALARSPARFVRGDYQQLDFGDYDLVYAYLSPAAMPALWRKARAEMKRGSVLASYEFGVPGQAPAEVVLPQGSGRHLYIWRF